MIEKYYVTCIDINDKTSNFVTDKSNSKLPYNKFINQVLIDKKIKGLVIYDGCDATINRQYFFIVTTYIGADHVTEIAEEYDMECTIKRYYQS